MKKCQLLAILLALILMISALPITASAAYYRESVSINVDGTSIDDVDVYLDDDNCVRVSTFEDLLKIFPQELRDTIIAHHDPWDGILVQKYVDKFGYESHLKVSYDNGNYFYYTLYISTSTSKQGNYSPGTDFKHPEFYINGMYTPAFDFYQYLNLDFSQYNTTILSGNRIYLNNDGNTPVEIVVDGHLIHFPDQQPIVMDPDGRAMVPVHTIAEMLGFKVDWDTKQNCTVIIQGENIMHIYPGNTSYLFNGHYYAMDIQPILLNGRTMVPICFVAEAFGYTVDFHSGDVLTVFLNSK
jgi:hypothetical protein